MNNTTYLNKNFRFVFSPNFNDGLFELFTNDYTKRKSKRFLVGAGSLSNWIGTKNAQTVIKYALKSKTDKVTVKFRKYGKIEIYVK